jgi:ribonucleoside-diphosphate reductase alpha chain
MDTAPQTAFASEIQPGRALSIERYFTTAGIAPFDTVDWELRTAAVGSFRQDDVEFPKTSSRRSTSVASSTRPRASAPSSR